MQRAQQTQATARPTAGDGRYDPQPPEPGRGGWWRAWGQDAAWMLGVVLVALVVRVIYVWQLQSSPWFAQHEMDPLFHHESAKAWAAGEVLMEGPYFRAPLYTWFLGIIYWLFGTGPLLPRLVQAVLGALNCGLLVLIGRHAFNRTVGVLAGLGAAVYWVFVYFDAELVSPVLIVFLNLTLLWRLLRTGARRKPLHWLFNGVLLGLSAIARPDILLFAAPLVAWLLVLHWPHWRRAAGYALCLLGGCVLCIAPITIRNYVVGHDRVLIASYGGVNLYIGNNPGADGMSAVIPGDPTEWWPCYRAQVERAERAAGRELKPSEVSRYYVRAAWEYVRSHPGEALARMFRKVAYFWSHWEISNNQDIYFVTSRYTPIVRFLPLSFWVVGPLGFLGLLLSLSRLRTLFPLAGLVVVYMLVVAAFFATARFRVPAVFVLILLGSHAVYWCVQAVRARRGGVLTLAGLVLLGIGLVVARIPPDVDRASIQGHRFAGYALAEQGRFAEAESLLLEAIAREARRGATTGADTWRALGFAQLKQEKFGPAEESCRRALALDPGNATISYQLALALLMQTKTDEAIEQLQMAAQMDPNNALYQVTLGNTLIRAGRVDEGQRYVLQAVELEPAHGDTLVKIAGGLIEQSRYAEAVRLLRGGLHLTPDNPHMLVPLAQLLANSPVSTSSDRDEAVRLGKRAVEITHRQDALAWSALAIAHAAVQQYGEAIAAVRRALELARLHGQAGLARELEQDLRRYEAARSP